MPITGQHELRQDVLFWDKLLQFCLCRCQVSSVLLCSFPLITAKKLWREFGSGECGAVRGVRITHFHDLKGRGSGTGYGLAWAPGPRWGTSAQPPLSLHHLLFSSWVEGRPCDPGPLGDVPWAPVFLEGSPKWCRMLFHNLTCFIQDLFTKPE